MPSARSEREQKSFMPSNRANRFAYQRKPFRPGAIVSKRHKPSTLRQHASMPAQLRLAERAHRGYQSTHARSAPRRLVRYRSTRRQRNDTPSNQRLNRHRARHAPSPLRPRRVEETPRTGKSCPCNRFRADAIPCNKGLQRTLWKGAKSPLGCHFHATHSAHLQQRPRSRAGSCSARRRT